jgi:hypothetical protein
MQHERSEGAELSIQEGSPTLFHIVVPARPGESGFAISQTIANSKNLS